MACKAETVISIARAEVGYLEKESNSQLDSKTANAGNKNYTKYARDYADFSGVNLQGQAWCDMFCDWCFVQAYGETKAKELLGGFSAYTPDSAQKFKNKGQWHSSPKAGDQIFFKNSQRICHTGIVSKVSGGKVYTIEGNTSGASGVIANGGGVCEKSYDLGYSRIAGYGRPKYDTETANYPQWVQSGNDWYYRLAEGQNAHGWQKIKNADGKTRWYHFANDGKMSTDWFEDGGKWYYAQPSGDLAGALYHTDNTGAQEIWIVE